jgi:PAS domain S-box-containing protein
MSRQEAAFKIDIEDIGVPVARLTGDGTSFCPNRYLCDLLGFSRKELSTSPFDELFQSGNPADEQSLRARLLNGELTHYTASRTALRKDGAQLLIQVAFSVIKDRKSSETKDLLAVVEERESLRKAEDSLREAETARRELARRLTSAQENERTRIARELHDHIGQSLAILRIQFLRAGRPVSGMPGHLHPSVTELCEKLREVAGNVSRLSHELHSSELEYLGLATAVESHCREFSLQQKIKVDCTCEGLPKNMDSLLALSLLRIVQEALHNIAKHSDAKWARVAIKASPQTLSLIVEDDGVGFDAEDAQLSAGLGLISMRERIHLAGGDFNITSRPGKGTVILAQVPLSALDQRDTPAAAP